MRNKEFEKWCDERGYRYRFYDNIGIVKSKCICQCKGFAKEHYSFRVELNWFEICCKHLKEIDNYDKLLSYILLSQ